MSYVRTQGFMSFPPVHFGQTEEAPSTDPNLENGSPPSSYAVVSVLDGEPGSFMRLIGLTFLRGCFILPGLWVAARVTKVELTSIQLVSLSFAGSATISAGMVAYYWIRRKTS